MNTYGYANQNPISFVDPDGLNPLASGRAGYVVGGAIAAALTAYTMQKYGTTFGGAIYDALHNESSEDSDAPPMPKEQPLPKSGKCNRSDWEFCYLKCGGRPKTAGCYVQYRWKTRSLTATGSIRDPEKIVNCNCDDDCSN